MILDKISLYQGWFSRKYDIDFNQLAKIVAVDSSIRAKNKQQVFFVGKRVI